MVLKPCGSGFFHNSGCIIGGRSLGKIVSKVLFDCNFLFLLGRFLSCDTFFRWLLRGYVFCDSVSKGILTACCFNGSLILSLLATSTSDFFSCGSSFGFACWGSFFFSTGTACRHMKPYFPERIETWRKRDKESAKTLAHVVEIDGTHNINGQYGDATRAIQRMLLIRERSSNQRACRTGDKRTLSGRLRDSCLSTTNHRETCLQRQTYKQSHPLNTQSHETIPWMYHKDTPSSSMTTGIKAPVAPVGDFVSCWSCRRELREYAKILLMWRLRVRVTRDQQQLSCLVLT